VRVEMLRNEALGKFAAAQICTDRMMNGTHATSSSARNCRLRTSDLMPASVMTIHPRPTASFWPS
jgi:hypothetical protein